MKPLGRTLVAALLLTLGAVAAHAELGPTKPSQLVTILSGQNGCGSSGNGTAVDSVGNGGATLEIPKKEVLVVTDVEVLQSGLNPGATGFVALDLEPENRTYFLMYVTAGPGGDAYGQRSLQHGFVVKPGTTICSFQSNATWTLRGYFTKDK